MWFKMLMPLLVGGTLGQEGQLPTPSPADCSELAPCGTCGDDHCHATGCPFRGYECNAWGDTSSGDASSDGTCRFNVVDYEWSDGASYFEEGSCEDHCSSFAGWECAAFEEYDDNLCGASFVASYACDEDIRSHMAQTHQGHYFCTCRKTPSPPATALGAPPGTTFTEERQRYMNLTAPGKQSYIEMIPQEWDPREVIYITALHSGVPDGNDGSNEWLDAGLARGSIHNHTPIVLAINGTSESCRLFFMNDEMLLYLHVHGNLEGGVMLHNWITVSTGAGVDWFPSVSEWKIRSDRKLEPLGPHRPEGPTRVLGWDEYAGRMWLVLPADNNALTFPPPPPQCPEGCIPASSRQLLFGTFYPDCPPDCTR